MPVTIAVVETTTQSRRHKGPILALLLTLIALTGAVVVGLQYRVAEAPAAVQSTASADPLAGIPIINVHEHLQSVQEVPLLLSVMDRTGVNKTILLGSSWFTITLNPAVGFTRYDWNNRQLLAVVKEYPDRFEAWPTLNPLDTDNVARLKEYVAEGATGLKLYLGHGYKVKSTGQYMFHSMPLDDPRMLPVYAYCEANFIPICFHVNPGPNAPGFAAEFVSVLTQFPNLKINCPHYMLSSIRDSRLRELLDTFPNLYTDISYGHDDFLKAGLKRISRNPDKYRQLFEEYPDRFMFGTDLVITNAPLKTEAWIEARFRAYLDMLSRSEYTTSVLPGETLRGVALPKPLLERILHTNYEEFSAKRPRDTALVRSVDWGKMGVSPTKPQP